MYLIFIGVLNVFMQLHLILVPSNWCLITNPTSQFTYMYSRLRHVQKNDKKLQNDIC